MQIFGPHRSIRGKLALLIAASVGAAVAIAFAVSGAREVGRFGEAKRAELEATAQVLATSVADHVAAGDKGASRRLLNAIGRVPHVRYAEIRDAHGRTFAEAGTGVALASAEEAPGGGAASTWRMLSEGSFFATAGIVKSGTPVGSLRLLIDTSELGERLRQALVAALASAAIAIGIGLFIASRMQRSITRPLGDLAETMNRVRITSDFHARAERRSDDETGLLVDAFNDMLDQVERRDAALAEHRAGLERTVEERTRDLATARDAAESANRAKSDFLATMSHEIRTPMNGMLVMAELLAGSELPARQQRYAETIARSGQTLLTIINDILDLSKIEAGKLELEQGRVSVATIVDDALALFSDRASSKGLALSAHIAPNVPALIEADPVRLSQVLSNLVNNALKFTERGRVTIFVERMDAGDAARAELLFAVEDTGIGIPADKVDRIFEAFSQADQSTTRRFGGTGLGLSICQRLVAAWGGRVWAKSEPSRGSRFAFTIGALILEASTEGAPRETRLSAITAELPSLPRLDILVADDSAVNREVVKEALARLAASTTVVEDGLRALEAFKAGRYDIVLMDCSMPVMDGFAAARAIRAWEAEKRGARTPIVALTAHVAGGADWRLAGMDDCLTKPFTIRGLADCLLRWKPAERFSPASVIATEPPGQHAPEPVMSQGEALDPTVIESLRAIAGGDSAMLRKLLGLFAAHAPARLQALGEALAAGDLERAATEAHALKSPAMNIGALRLGALCTDIEARARAGDTTLASEPDLQRVEARFAEVLAAIARERGDDPSASGQESASEAFAP